MDPTPLLPGKSRSDVSEVFDAEWLTLLERETVVFETEDGTEYVAGRQGWVLFVPRGE